MEGSKELELFQDTSECPICLETHQNADMAETACTHKLCKSCIIRLLKTSSRCPVCRQRISPFNSMCVDTREMLMEPFSTIFDSIYVQGGTKGIASYHFSEEESYISYAAAPPIWRLDDGSSPPEKKPFEETSYDPHIRIFKGVINWTPVSFHGDSKWVYEIKFSEDFMEIEGGEVTAYDIEGNKQRETHLFAYHLFYCRLLDYDLEKFNNN